MKLNCKPGDLALVVAGPAEGYIVRCIERFDGPWSDLTFDAGWRLDRAVPAIDGRVHHYKADAYLRPIRDPGEDAQDETLQWLDVPRKVAA